MEEVTAKKIGKMWMGHRAGDHTNHKENRSIRIAVSDLTKGIGHTQGAFTNSGGGDSSELSPGDIPHGLIIKCDGSASNGWGWAVVKPYGGGRFYPQLILTVTLFPISFSLLLGCTFTATTRWPKAATYEWMYTPLKRRTRRKTQLHRPGAGADICCRLFCCGR